MIIFTQMKNNSSIVGFSTLFLILFISNLAQSQVANPRQSALDSLKHMASKPTLSLSTEEKSILAARIFMMEGELQRSKVMVSRKINASPEELLASVFDSMPKTRGGQFIPFNSYKKYLNTLDASYCCRDLVDWKYENYSLSYNDFLTIKKLNEQIDFSKINYPLLHASIFYETNQKRKKAGITPLMFHQSLEAAAFGHAQDMKTYEFFSHTSVVSKKESVGDRALLAGFNWSWVGENIAKSFGIDYQAGTPVYSPNQNGGYFSYEYQGDPILPHTYLSFAKAIVKQWMDSPGHRANILNVNYGYLGVGAAHYQDDTFYKMDNFYGVQVFAN